MSATRRRVRAARAQLALSAFAAAVLWGLAAALLAFAAWTVADLLWNVDLGTRRLALPSVVLAFAGAAAAAMWRARHALSIPHVALWIEERVPALRYALVTATEMDAGAPAPIERAVASHRWDVDVARASARAILKPLVPLAAAVVLMALLPPGAVSRVASPVPGDALARVAVGDDRARSLLAPLVAAVHPPAYTGERERVIEEPFAIEALPGARIVLRGRGDHVRVSADVEGRTVRALRERDRWRIELPTPARPVAVRLSDGVHQRLLTIEPLVDEAPVVVLVSPQRDTVLRVGRGIVALEARLRDDFGLARGVFEYIISSGSGELFQFRTGTLGATSGAGARELTMRARLPLDSLVLVAGDVMHLRAVGWDANDIGGPGMGSSESRTIRIARGDEYDTVAVEGAPPPDLDADAVSQRMLIIQTERLEARRRRIPRDTLVAESRRLAQRQNLLRRRVAEIVFQRLGMQTDAEHSHGPGDGHDHSDEELMGFLTPERLLQEAGAATAVQGAAAMTGHAHDESPILAINQPLLEAYNHMWTASGELEIGEPPRALPPMRRALEALQRAREAERYFLRARSPRVVVDIARVRLASPQQVAPAARAAAAPELSRRARLSARLLAAVELLAKSQDAGMDSLLLVRLQALQDAPDAALALGEAAAALRSGRDATEALVRARRAIEGEVQVRADRGWRGGW